MQTRLATYKHDLTSNERLIVEITGKIAVLAKTRKAYEKAALTSPRAVQLLEAALSKTVKAERELADAKKAAEGSKRLVSQSAANIESFLKVAPKGFATNAELLKRYAEEERLEDELFSL